MIEAVVFDFGGVLTQPFLPAVVRAATEAGLDPIRLGSLLQPMFAGAEDTDLPAHRLERGEITLEAFFGSLGDGEAAARTLLDPTSPFFVLARLRPHEGMLAFSREAHASGRQTAILTNDAIEWRPAWDAVIGPATQFEHVVRSSLLGIRKPDPRAYAAVIDRLGVDAGECVFIDDFAPMAEAGRAAGMHAIHLVDHDAGIAEARRVLGLAR